MVQCLHGDGGGGAPVHGRRADVRDGPAPRPVDGHVARVVGAHRRVRPGRGVAGGWHGVDGRLADRPLRPRAIERAGVGADGAIAGEPAHDRRRRRRGTPVDGPDAVGDPAGGSRVRRAGGRGGTGDVRSRAPPPRPAGETTEERRHQRIRPTAHLPLARDARRPQPPPLGSAAGGCRRHPRRGPHPAGRAGRPRPRDRAVRPVRVAMRRRAGRPRRRQPRRRCRSRPGDRRRARARLLVHRRGRRRARRRHCRSPRGRRSAGPNTLRRLACDARVQLLGEGPGAEALARTALEHTVPHWLRRQLRHRDGGCRWKGCQRTRALHAHHLVWFSKGGKTTLSNLVLLCRRHHRAVHEGGWRIKGDPSGTLRFVRPDGRPLPERPPPLTPDRREWLRTHLPNLGAIPRLAFGPG